MHTSRTAASGVLGRPVSPLAAAMICAVGVGTVMYDQTSLVISAPSIAAQFDAGLSGLQWLTVIFPLVAASTMPLSGLLGQRLGARTTIQLGLILVALASVAASLAPGMGTLLGARVIQGVGSALVLPNAATLLGANVKDPLQRTRAIGLWMTTSSSALLVGPFLGGVLVEQVGWRATFLINVPFALAALLLLPRLRNTVRSAPGRIDLAGLVLASATLALVAWSLIASGRDDAPWLAIAMTSALAVLLMMAFVLVERRVSHPLLEVEIFRPRRLRLVLLACLIYNAAINGTAILISVHFQDQRGFSASSVGLMLLVANAGMPLAGLLVNRLRRHRDNVQLMGIGLWVLAGAYLWMGIGTGWHPIALGLPLIAIGLGAGILYFVDTNTVLELVTGPQTASAMAALALMRQIGSVIGIAALASLGQLAVNSGLGTTPEPPAFLLSAAILAVIAVVASWSLSRRNA